MKVQTNKHTYCVVFQYLQQLHNMYNAGLSSLGVHPQILVDQLTLSQPGGADYAHHITTGTPGFSDLPTALSVCTSLT